MVGNSKIFPNIALMNPGDTREYLRWDNLAKFVRPSEDVIGLPWTAASLNSLLDAVDLCAPEREHSLQHLTLTHKGELTNTHVSGIGLVAVLGVSVKGSTRSLKEVGNIVIAPNEHGTRVEVTHVY